MFENDQSEAKPESTALVPLAPMPPRSDRLWWRWAPDPIFVTHLIAAAQQVPQARRIRRGSLEDAKTAYQAQQNPTRKAGGRIHQDI